MIVSRLRFARFTSTRTAALACLAIAVGTLAGVWWPEFAHYWVPTPHYSWATVEQSRLLPNAATLERISAIEFEAGGKKSSRSESVSNAEAASRGKWTDDFGTRALRLPFDRADLTAGWGTEQLRFASLKHLDAIVSGYEATGDVRFLATAKDVVNAWAAFERAAILPRGLLWNDHAIAKRIFVMTRYWRLFRQSSLYDPESGRLVLEFIGRSGRMLADHRHFTVRTNHGLIQNVALLHIAAAFPALPDAENFRRVAVERLRVQLSFYQSGEGVVLEHSSGYHAAGMTLLEAVLEYRDLIGSDIALNVERRLRSACRFVVKLVRPDGTLPLIGDTPAQPAVINCAQSDPAVGSGPNGAAGLSVYPVSGYAINWLVKAGRLDQPLVSSQTVVTWGNFASGAHKHADDMAIVTWSDGAPILSGTGYWPYGHSLQDAAHSWRGANAPHFDWEQSDAARDTELLWTGAAGDLSVVDLRRTTSRPDSSIRRQVIAIGFGEWLVLDFAKSSRAGSVSTVWTFSPQWKESDQTLPGVFRLGSSNTGRQLSTSVASVAKLELRELTGSETPFGGFVALCMAPSCIRTAVSLDVRAAANIPVATFVSTAPVAGSGSLVIRRWVTPSRWTLCLDGTGCRRQLKRHDSRVQFTERGISEVVDLTRAATQVAGKKLINDNYRSAAASYPTWRDYYPYRVAVTLVLVALFAVQEALFGAMNLVFRKRPSKVAEMLPILRWLAVPIWAFAGAWTIFRYLGEPT